MTTQNRYDQSWEPRVAKLILEKLKSNKHNEEEEVIDDPALISNNNNDDDGSTSSYQKPLMVALVGIPGGGKSVSSLILATLLEEQGVPIMIMPHDGYHLPMDQLRQYPDAKDRIYRRGAPDTFDPTALQRDLDRIRNNPNHEEGLIMVPGFEHAKGDPEPDKHIFDRNHHRVVIGEGLVRVLDQTILTVCVHDSCFQNLNFFRFFFATRHTFFSCFSCSIFFTTKMAGKILHPTLILKFLLNQMLTIACRD